MAHYRLYCLDDKHKISTAEWIEANNDEEAIAIARTMSPSFDSELWLSNRLAAELPAHSVQA